MKSNYYDIGKKIIIIIIIAAAGVFLVNQALEFKYRSAFLQTPCSLCLELNTHLEECFVDKSTITIYDNTRKEKEEINLSKLIPSD